MEKQWTGSETEGKIIDDVTKNGEERSLSTSTTSSVDEALPKVNPVKWTVMKNTLHIHVVTKERNDQMVMIMMTMDKNF